LEMIVLDEQDSKWIEIKEADEKKPRFEPLESFDKSKISIIYCANELLKTFVK